MRSRPPLFAVIFFIAAFPSATLGAPVKIGISGDYLYLPFFVAHELKLFDRSGAPARLEVYPSAVKAAAALAGGEVPLAAATEWNLLAAYAKNPSFVLVARLAYPSRGFQVIARSNVKGPKDLKGKSVGTDLSPAHEYALEKFLDGWGVDRSTVGIDRRPSQKLVGELDSGSIQAILVYEPWADRALRLLGAKGKVLGFATPEEGRGPALYIGIHRELLRNDPEGVRRILQALGQAVQFIHARPEAAAAIMERRGQGQSDVAVQLISRLNFSLQWNLEGDEGLRAIGEWMKAKGLVRPEVSWDSLIVTGFRP